MGGLMLGLDAVLLCPE